MEDRLNLRFFLKCIHISVISIYTATIFLSTTRVLSFNKYFYETKQVKCYLDASFEEFVKLKCWKITASSNVSYFTGEYTFAQLNIGIPSKDSSHMLRSSTAQIENVILHFLYVCHVLLRYLTFSGDSIKPWWVVGLTQFMSLVSLVQLIYTKWQPMLLPSPSMESESSMPAQVWVAFSFIFFSECPACCSWERGVCCIDSQV